MAKSVLSYKGYNGSFEISLEDDCLHGKILFINDLLTYEAERPSELESAFRQAVDRYIAYCVRTGKSADKPYSGTFNVRIGAELHREACTAAAERDLNLNEFVRDCIANEVRRSSQPSVQEIHHIHHNQTKELYNEDTAQLWQQKVLSAKSKPH